jgi:hypothetical protein
MQGIEIPIGAPLGQLDRDLKGAEKKLKGFTSSAETDLKGFSSTASSAFKTAGLALAGAFSVGAFVSFGKEVLAVTAEFEKFGAVLGNTLGSNALAKLKLKEIEEFAAKTPFSVNELTESFVKLANQGFKPTGDEMRRLGDLASSTGKSFNQLAEAILDAQTGEFERLKEFGIRAQDAGNKVIFTFKGVQTTVDKSSEAIRNYVTSLGDAEGVSGSMAVISQTLSGKISNLGDSWDQMLISIGGNTSGVFKGAIDVISKAINEITGFNKGLEIASKYKLKQDFGLSFQQGKLKLGDVKDQVSQVESAQKSVGKYIKSIQQLSKTPADFKSAMQSLADIANEELSKIKDKNLGKAVADQYKQGIEVLRALSVEAGKPIKTGAVFGTAKKEKAQKTEKNTRDPQFKAQSSINELDLFLENYKKTEAQLNKTPLVPFPKLKEKLQVVNQALIEFNASANDIIQNSIINTFNNLGTAIGESLATGGNVLKAVGNTILQGLAGFLSEMGSLLIKYGTLAVLKGKLDIAILTGGPVAIGAGLAAIAAGIALKAAGGALGSLARGGAGGGGGGSSSGAGSVPLPQGSASISTSAAGSAQDFGSGAVVFEISGANLIGVLNRAGAKLTRYGP